MKKVYINCDFQEGIASIVRSNAMKLENFWAVGLFASRSLKNVSQNARAQ